MSLGCRRVHWPDVRGRRDRCTAPLFATTVTEIYDLFMNMLFETFGEWGRDAQLKSGYGRRREANPGWESEWSDYFTYPKGREISSEELLQIRRAYSALLGGNGDVLGAGSRRR